MIIKCRNERKMEEDVSLNKINEKLNKNFLKEGRPRVRFIAIFASCLLLMLMVSKHFAKKIDFNVFYVGLSV